MDQIGGRMLRLLVLGVRAQRPRRYYLSFQVLAPGTTAAAALPSLNGEGVESTAVLPPDVVCRTETASLGKCPEFTNRAFLLRLPATLGTAGSSGISNTDAGPRLAVQLFAAPSAEDPMGPIIAGKEVDPLVAQGSIELAGSDVGARLAAGQSVMVPLQLADAEGNRKPQALLAGLGGQTAQLQSLRSSLAATAAANLYGSTETQVLLELHLLDVKQLYLASNSSALQQQGSVNMNLASTGSQGQLNQSMDAQQLQQQQQWSGSPAAGRPGSRNAQALAAMMTTPEGPQLELFVLVSAAANLPMVPGSDSHQLEPPRAFVTLKSLAGVEAGRPAQAMTAVAPPGQNPCWSQLLQLLYLERDLPHEQLLIAVEHESRAGQCRVLLKGSLRLATLIPGQHYNLAMALSDLCTLYITVVIGLGAATQHDALQGGGIGTRAGAASMCLLQLRLANSSQPLQTLLDAVGLMPAGGSSASGNNSEIWAVWRAKPRPQSSTPLRQQEQQHMYVLVDGREGSERAAAGILRRVNGSNGMLSAAVVAASDTGDDRNGTEGVVAALPLLAVPQTAGMLWPADHMLLLPCWNSTPTAAVLELYFQPYTAGSNSSSKGSSSSSSKGSNSSSKELPPATCFARLELPYSAIAPLQQGKSSVIKDLHLTGVSAAAGDNHQSRFTCTFEVVAWEIAAYLGHLKQLAAAAQAASATAASTRRVELSRSHQDNSCMALSRTPHAQNMVSFPNQRTAAAATAASTQDLSQWDVFETLVGDSLAKQQVLEKLQRSLAAAENRREAAACRIADLQSMNSRLTRDLQHLRQLLHVEKSAQAAALSTHSSATDPAFAHASREELHKQLDIVAAAREKERARNAELVHRLQQLHAEQVDVIELQKQYAELQEAHYQQSQLLTDQEATAATVATLKKAVTDQEGVISRLESLLAAAVNRSKDGETWRTTADALQMETTRLREEIARLAAARPAEELAAAAAHAAAAEQQAAAAALIEKEGAVAMTISNYECQLSAKESDRLAAHMRAEKAEAAAIAAQNELLEVTKRYAREIAQLKTKLAEKDAQLLGGFGSLANLYLSEMPAGMPGGLESTLNLNSTPMVLGVFSPGPAQALGLGQLGGVQSCRGLAGSDLEGSGTGVGLGFNPNWAVQLGAGNLAAAAAAARTGVAPTAAAAGSRICSAGGACSPKLQPVAGDTGAAAAAAAAGAGYFMRAGTAESLLGAVKPGSPLAPVPAQRLTNSAEGIRSGNGRLGLLREGNSSSSSSNRHDRAAAAAATGSQEQQQRRTRELQLELDSSSQYSIRGGSPNAAASPTAAAAAAAVQSRRSAGAAAVAENPVRSPVVTNKSTKQQSLHQQQQQQWQQQQQRSPERLTAELQEEQDDGEYEDSQYAQVDAQIEGLSLEQLQQMQLQQQVQGQLILSAAQRQQRQQQQGLRSPAGQLTPPYSASSAAESTAGQQQQQQTAKTGFRKWFG